MKQQLRVLVLLALPALSGGPAAAATVTDETAARPNFASVGIVDGDSIALAMAIHRDLQFVPIELSIYDNPTIAEVQALASVGANVDTLRSADFRNRRAELIRKSLTSDFGIPASEVYTAVDLAADDPLKAPFLRFQCPVKQVTHTVQSIAERFPQLNRISGFVNSVYPAVSPEPSKQIARDPMFPVYYLVDGDNAALFEKLRSVPGVQVVDQGAKGTVLLIRSKSALSQIRDHSAVRILPGDGNPKHPPGTKRYRLWIGREEREAVLKRIPDDVMIVSSESSSIRLCIEANLIQKQKIEDAGLTLYEIVREPDE